MNPVVNVSDEITLVSLHDIPANMQQIADIFEKIASMGIDVDMISLSPVQSASTSLSFTIRDADLIKLLEFTSGLQGGRVKPIVSSGNYIVSVLDKQMENTPGIAAKIFRAVADVNTDIRVISTSEVQISLLVTKADFDAVYESILNCVKTI
ncbi:MAG TPA: hypothetical protein IAD32_03050 [Candidatus Scatavimonas merdigallinarum]|uniref:aspartate kinase n=1 Tax=Candidatus Scatavimonas merdigallinarum TaxID=2840914 RepID=A0A9D0ZHD9_9FIRM|nr:hypothetical protein [Candidatus Scatavimonas merdigallinarum]